MSWLAGLTAGVSEGVSDAHERRRQRIEQQMEEAKKLSSVAKTRSAKAKQVSQQIEQAHARFGVSKETLFSAYKAGQLETLLGLYDSPDMTPAMRESLWKVPESQVSLEAGESIYDQINKAMGAISMGVKSIPEDQRNDYNVGSLLSRMMGGYTPDSINLALDEQTVEGFDVNELLNMPEPESLIPDQGANFNYDVIRQAELAGKLRGRVGTGGGSTDKNPFSVSNVRMYAKEVAAERLPDIVKTLKEDLGVNLADEGIFELVLEGVSSGAAEKAVMVVAAGGSPEDVNLVLEESLKPENILKRYGPLLGVQSGPETDDLEEDEGLPQTTFR